MILTADFTHGVCHTVKKKPKKHYMYMSLGQKCGFNQMESLNHICMVHTVTGHVWTLPDVYGIHGLKW